MRKLAGLSDCELVVGDNVIIRLNVQCYAGCKADERPLRFQLNDHEYLVEEVIDRWYGPGHVTIKNRAELECLLRVS